MNLDIISNANPKTYSLVLDYHLYIHSIWKILFIRAWFFFKMETKSLKKNENKKVVLPPAVLKPDTQEKKNHASKQHCYGLFDWKQLQENSYHTS